MVKRALLIGINYVAHPENKLNGCVNDIFALKEVLVNKLEFDEGDITLLYDEGNDGEPESHPNALSIKNALEGLISASEDGDVLLIHYSGHGTQNPDPSGEEEDHKDECLVSADLVLITDDWLKSQFCQLSHGVHLTFIADCCHSGSLLDQPTQDVEISGEKDEEEGAEYEDSGLESTNRNLDWSTVMAAIQAQYGDVNSFMAANPFVADELAAEVEDDGDASTWNNAAINAARVRPDTSGLSNAALITGCEDHQTSADYLFNQEEGIANGALTWGLISVLNESDEVPTYRELVSKARGKIASYPGTKFDQNPCLVCPDDLADALFACAP